MTLLSHKIVREIGVISTSVKGYTKEINMVSWNSSDAKLDIRNWTPNRECGKGITLSIKEAKALRKLLNNICLEDEFYDED